MINFEYADLVRMNKVLRHRLRNLSSGVHNAVSLLAKELDDRLKPGEKEYFPLILNECQELRRLTDRMNLLFDDLMPGPAARLEDILSRVTAQVHAEYPMAVLTVSGDGSLRAMLWACQWCGVVLAELVMNAVQAKAGAEVRIVAEQTATGLVVHVTDSGVGIPDAQEADAFLPFFTTRPRHMGVGLAVARRWSRQLGGEVSRGESRPGEFRMDLYVPTGRAPAGEEQDTYFGVMTETPATQETDKVI